ncbi:MAG TPA: hypothetical protein VK137_07155, partial [Planctomycetaceae bacterium]|nr:hypothetical protein [Planctomycetaceae bacterium]
QCTSPRGGEVILTDLFYPGWEVTVDGQPAEPRRVEGMYRGVEVPVGEHTIAWTFRPKSVTRGMVVSGIAGIMWVIVGLYFRFAGTDQMRTEKLKCPTP